MEETTKTTTTKPARFTINGELDGFPFAVSFRGKADVLKATVAKLKAAGATPPRVIVPTSASESATDAPPLCPVHKAKMKASKKPGVWFCPKREGDDYCSEKVARK